MKNIRYKIERKLDRYNLREFLDLADEIKGYEPDILEILDEYED